MQNKKIKLSLYIESVNIDGDIPFVVMPESDHKIEEGLYVYDFYYDPSQVFKFAIEIGSHTCTQSHLKIIKILAGTYDISATTTQCYTYIGQNNEQYQTYNYLSWPGKFTVKIRYSPHIHQYLTNLYNMCFKKSLT